jgi:hypothetical protein
MKIGLQPLKASELLMRQWSVPMHLQYSRPKLDLLDSDIDSRKVQVHRLHSQFKHEHFYGSDKTIRWTEAWHIGAKEKGQGSSPEVL